MKFRSDIILFILLLGGFVAYKGMEMWYLPPPLMRAYWEDLLAVPLLLQTALWTTHALFPAHRGFILGNFSGILFLVAFSVYFEVYLPHVDQRFTSDLVDALCYSLGYFAFARWMNKPTNVRLTLFKPQSYF